MKTYLGRHAVTPGLLTRSLVKVIGPSAYLEVPASIVPGEPLSVTWQALGYKRDSNAGGVAAKIFVNSQLLYASPAPVPLVNGEWIAASEPQAITILPPTDPGLASDLYRIGTKTIRLEITDARGEGLPPAEDTIEVISEGVGPLWWTWSFTSPTAYLGETYVLGGSLTNRNQWAKLHGSVTLREYLWSGWVFAYAGDVAVVTPRGTVVIELGPGATANVEFPRIEPKWQWIALHEGRVERPLPWPFEQAVGYQLRDLNHVGRWYHYFPRILLEDDYGNRYPEVDPPPSILDNTWSLPVIRHFAREKHVIIPDAKIRLGDTADSLLHTAHWLMYFSWLIPAADRIAQHLIELAEGYVLAANDPPEPDPRFKEQVDIPGDEFFGALTQDESLRPVYSALDLIGRFLRAWQAQGTIHGRLLGACEAGDETATRRQLEAYRNVVNGLLLDAAELLRAARDAVRVIEADERLTQERIAVGLASWPEQGIPREVSQEWRDQGLSEAALERLEASARVPETVRGAPFIDSLLETAAQSLGGVAYDLRELMPSVVSAALRSLPKGGAQPSSQA